MKLLLAISEAPPLQSGFARIADRLSSGFRKAGHEVVILSTRETGRFSVGEMRPTGLLPRWPRLRRLLDGVDLAAVFGPTPTFTDALLPLLRSRRNRPRIVYTHVFDIDLPGLNPLCEIYNRLHRRLARLADRVVVATPDYVSHLDRVVPGERIRVIPWGIDPVPEEPSPSKADRFTVLHVGQLRRYKGGESLLLAARQLPEIRFLMVGEGPDRDHLQDLVRRWQLANVEIRSDVSNAELSLLYREAHVVSLPSICRLEAFGLVLVEGMAHGCVPVASSLPGVRHVVDDVGFTHPPGDAEALAHTLARLDRDREELEQYSRRARAHSLGFSWD
ncbi:MAG: glycosyltransferase family 4 protein, partial [Myxococcota bacterium]